MKERLKELWYSIEDKLRSLCGEITPDKRITVILIMLLVFTALSLYMSVSSIYNWGKESERKKQIQIEHIRQLELEKRQWDYEEFIDAEVEKRLYDLYRQQLEQDSVENMENEDLHKQSFKEYEERHNNKFGSEAKA